MTIKNDDNSVVQSVQRVYENIVATQQILLEISNERTRQQHVLGYNSKLDDKKTGNELPLLAVRYVYDGVLQASPKVRREHLVKAAALLVAELERMERASGNVGEENSAAWAKTFDMIDKATGS